MKLFNPRKLGTTVLAMMIVVALPIKPAVANEYYQKQISCELSATRQTFGSAPVAFPRSLKIKINADFVKGNDSRPTNWSWDLLGADNSSEKPSLIPALRPLRLRHKSMERNFSGGYSFPVDTDYDHRVRRERYDLSFNEMTPIQLHTLLNVLNGGIDPSLDALLDLTGQGASFDELKILDTEMWTTSVNHGPWSTTANKGAVAGNSVVQIHSDSAKAKSIQGLSIHLGMNCSLDHPEQVASQLDSESRVASIKEPLYQGQEATVTDSVVKDLDVSSPNIDSANKQASSSSKAAI